MKILFITNAKNLNYVRDSVFHGLIDSNYDVIDTTYLKILSDRNALGQQSRKFSLYGKLPLRENINRLNIIERIKNKEFDYIFYGCVSYLEYFDIVKNIYDPQHIIILCGSDKFTKEKYIDEYQKYSNYANIFIRELDNFYHENIHPISYGIPENCFIKTNPNKIRKTSLLIPGDLSTYIYKTEKEYYTQYQNSQFAFTSKKGGWDCLRHYEIISQKCLPVFINFNDKPRYTMTNWPDDLQCKVNLLFFEHKIDLTYYNQLLTQFFDYAINHFTTKCLIKYIFNCIK